MVECPKCIEGPLLRTRRGFFTRLLSALSGAYPWRCLNCKSSFFIHDAGPHSTTD